MQDSRIKITKGQSGEVTVTLPYNPVHIEKLKEIEGHKWNPEQKCWTFPRSNDTIKNLLAIFRDKDVWVEPSLEQEVVGDLFENLRRELVSRKICFANAFHTTLEESISLYTPSLLALDPLLLYTSDTQKQVDLSTFLMDLSHPNTQ